MNAKVSQNFKWDTVNAFSGNEFVRYEWRRVPEGCEVEAHDHPHLEVEPITVVAPPKPRKRTPAKAKGK